jgi:hypothetical protein
MTFVKGLKVKLGEPRSHATADNQRADQYE